MADANQDDQQMTIWVLQAQAGDMTAFDALVQASARSMLRLAHYLLGSEEAAWDAVQDAYLTAQRTLRSLRQPEAFRDWLRSIVANTCLMELRRRKRRPDSLDAPQLFPNGSERPKELADWARDPAGAFEQAALCQALERAILSLPPELRAVFALREFEGRRYSEIAGLLGIRIGTVRSRLFRARELLRTALDQWR